MQLFETPQRHLMIKIKANQGDDWKVFIREKKRKEERNKERELESVTFI